MAVFACTQSSKQGRRVTDVMQPSKIAQIRVKSVDNATPSVWYLEAIPLNGFE